MTPEKMKRVRLHGDRYCYLSGGADALRYRTGMIRVYGKTWIDEFDMQAAKALYGMTLEVNKGESQP